MALIYKDRVQETTTTEGDSTITLLGAVSGFQAFSAVGDGNTCIYCIEDANGAWEVGVGTYTSSGTTLARTTLLASSTGSAISLSSGTHKVYVTADASALQQTQLRIKPETVTTGDITGEVGTQHVCTIAGLTANRDFVLPAVCAVGDRVSVMVVDGDDTYALLIKAASGDTINGGSAGAEWSRLFLAGEVVTLRCITANSAWIVEYDGRIPINCRSTAAGTGTTTQSISATTYTSLNANIFTEEIDNCNAMGSDAGSKLRFTARRAGQFIVAAGAYLNMDQDQKTYIGAIQKNGEAAPVTKLWRAWSSGGAGGCPMANTGVSGKELAADDYLNIMVYHDASAAKPIADNVGFTFLSIVEVI